MFDIRVEKQGQSLEQLIWQVETTIRSEIPVNKEIYLVEQRETDEFYIFTYDEMKDEKKKTGESG